MICWLLCVVLSPGYGLAAQGHRPATSDFRRFAGTWVAHGSLLTVAPAGLATFVGRTYRWCACGVPQPCDTIDAQGRRVGGNRDQLQFVRTAGARAYGAVLSSTFHPVGLAVTLTLQPADTMLSAARTPIALLCARSRGCPVLSR